MNSQKEELTTPNCVWGENSSRPKWLQHTGQVHRLTAMITCNREADWRRAPMMTMQEETFPHHDVSGQHNLYLSGVHLQSTTYTLVLLLTVAVNSKFESGDVHSAVSIKSYVPTFNRNKLEEATNRSDCLKAK